MSDPNIRVALVAGHSIVRHGLRRMLETAPDIEVSGEARTAREAMRLTRSRDFEVALLDIELPDRSGLQLLPWLRHEKPGLAVVMLSMQSLEAYALRAIRLGAAAFLTQEVSMHSLLEAIRKAAAGGRHITPELAEKLVDLISGGHAPPHEILSDRELEVLRRLAAGERLVRIAVRLNISPSTVTTYRARILEKTGLDSNARLIRYALEHGLLN